MVSDASTRSGGSPVRRLPPLPLQWKITALVVAVVLFSGLVAGYFVANALVRQIDDSVGNRMLGLARMIAARTEVVQGFQADDPDAVLQPLAELWMDRAMVDFIVILNMDGMRYSHPNRSLVGYHFTGGDEGPALLGEEYVSHAVGISGPSMRAFSPVYDQEGRQIGVVVVGTWMSSFDAQVRNAIGDMAAVSLLGLAVGIIGAAAVAYNIKGSILGLEPEQIRAMLEERVAILQSIREGVVAVDRDSRITMLNREAERLLGVGQECIGRSVMEVLPNSRLPQIVATARSEFDQEQVIRGTVILTNRVPIRVQGKVVGAVATFRDMSEIRELAAELTGVKQLAETLRAQAHEFVNRLHTVSGLLQLGRQQDAIEYVAAVASSHEEMVGFVTKRIHDPAVAGLLLGKVSAANERGITLSLDPDSYVPVRDDGLRRVDLVAVVGNLIENAFDAVSALPQERRNVWVSMYSDDEEMLIEVEDTGVRIEDHNRSRIFDRGFTTKPGNRGIGLPLVVQEISRVGGTIDVESMAGTGTRCTVRLPKTGNGRVGSSGD